MYYREVSKAISFGGFDSIAHFDFPKRYLSGSSEPKEMLNEIIKELIRNGISLELNSSPLRKGKTEAYPSKEICQLYYQNGGRKVTLGSDAHSENEIGKDFTVLYENIKKYKFQIVSYCNRKEDQMVYVE
jgi:histidinol-phosphatase (PHP family)